jgi:hypothetical protein
MQEKFRFKIKKNISLRSELKLNVPSTVRINQEFYPVFRY